MDLSPSAAGHCLPRLTCRLQCEKFMVQTTAGGGEEASVIVNGLLFSFSRTSLGNLYQKPP